MVVDAPRGMQQMTVSRERGNYGNLREMLIY